MKNWFKHISILFTGAALLTISCEDSNTVVDQVVDGTERGAILRTANLISNELPIGDSAAGFSVELEVQDEENGALVSSVEVYIGFRDNSDDVGPGTDVAESLYDTVDASTFTTGPFGLPRFSYAATLTEMLSFVGRTEADITGGDQFTVRFELVLTDGRRYSFADNTGTLTGSFFRSPFLYTPTVICPIPATAFVGDYTLSVNTSPIGGVPVWSETTVTLSVGANSTQRVFSATYLGGLNIGNGPREFAFDLICGNIFPTSAQASGLGCADTIFFGPQADGDAPGTYDITDDTTFTIAFSEDESNGCGGPVPGFATLTKL
ncbi:MAG: hypothetical protein ABGX00_07285 [Allomuricauda sp.]